MRYVTLLATWKQGHLHPLAADFADHSSVTIEETYYINPVSANEYAELGRISGDLDTATTILAESPLVEHFSLSDSGDGFVYLHYASSGLVDEMLDVLFENAVTVQWPVVYTHHEGSRGMQITLIGNDGALQQASRDLPAALDVHVQRTGDFGGKVQSVPVDLTRTQREVLRTAVEMGYYESPRQTTHKAIADRLGKATGTVGEQLQRIESTVLPTIVE